MSLNCVSCPDILLTLGMPASALSLPWPGFRV
jgi:hypothetical protein